MREKRKKGKKCANHVREKGETKFGELKGEKNAEYISIVAQLLCKNCINNISQLAKLRQLTRQMITKQIESHNSYKS
jgi:hypothetical protein